MVERTQTNLNPAESEDKNLFEDKLKLMVENQKSAEVISMIRQNPILAAQISQNGLLEFSKGLINNAPYNSPQRLIYQQLSSCIAELNEEFKEENKLNPVRRL